VTDDSTGRVWYAVEVVVTRAALEAIEFGLMEAQALGTETVNGTETNNIRGYFDHEPGIESIRAALRDALRIYDLPADAIIEVRVAEVPDRDWLAEWKKNWRPVEVGRFIIAPPWFVSEPGALATGSNDPQRSNDSVAIVPGPDTIVIRINPGMAFGTGTHETTRLCLKAIEKHYRGGSFLDVGTGTGILAIAAAMCRQPDRQGGPPSITACDIDADAVTIAKENAELNGVADRIDFRAGTVGQETGSADLVCANLTAPVIMELLPKLIGATCGRLILSGILDSQSEMITAQLMELGMVDFEIDQDGEWIAIVA